MEFGYNSIKQKQRILIILLVGKKIKLEKIEILEELTEDAVVDTVNKYRQGILHEETKNSTDQ